MLDTIRWTGQAVELLDQTQLPTRTVYLTISDEKQMHDAIRRLAIRGAPAIGVAAAFGAYLGVRPFPARDDREFLKRLDEVCDYLATSRPTAVNLFWAMKRMQKSARMTSGVDQIKVKLLDECLTMLQEDASVCRAIGEHGAALLRSLKSARSFNILTHCNAGSLCSVRYGTALAPIYVGVEQGLQFHVYADETRPLMQGSRITAFELKQNNVPVTVLCDNMAASLMSQKKIDAVIVGADRIAANGDVANKIGTLGVAILARHFRVPFFVAAPMSTIDLDTPTGQEIPIEQRDANEVIKPLGAVQAAPDGVEVFNPAFDVTPAELVDAIITERGVLRPPYARSLKG
jgi:methylthioribose-1-phosphate isomerase